MGDKRLKLARGLGDMTKVSVTFHQTISKMKTPPTSTNFSQLEKECSENDIEFNPSDECSEVLRIEDELVYEELLVLILCNLELREKLVFLYQILRDGGYQIDHASFAKTVGLSRRQYMRVLEDVRLKSLLFIEGYRQMQRCQVTKGVEKP